MGKIFLIIFASLAFLIISPAETQAVQPELVIVSVNFDPAKGYSIPTIKNLGNATAVNRFSVSQTWLMLDESPTGQVGIIEFAGNIAPGQTQTPISNQTEAVKSAWLPQDRAVKVRLAVDIDNKIAESDESNNEKIFDRALPDLKIDSVAIDPATLKPSLKVTNSGTFAVTKWGDTQVGLYLLGSDGMVIPSLSSEKLVSSVFNQSLAPGSSFTVALDKPVPATAVRYSAYIQAMYNLVPLDVNESNDILEGDVLDIFPSDLVIVEPVNFSDQGYAKPVIRNQGKGNAGRFFVRQTWLRSDGSETGKSVNLEYADGVAADGIRALRPSRQTITDDWLPPPDAAKAQLLIDPSNAIVESDKNNNKTVFNRILPNLVILDPLGIDSDFKTFTVQFQNVDYGAAKFGPAWNNPVQWEAAWLAADGRELDKNSGWLEPNNFPNRNVVLEIGQVITKSIGPVNSSKVASAVSVRLTVDSTDKIAESDENNTKQVDFPLPDLVILDPVNFSSSGSKQVEATFKNTGNVSFSLGSNLNNMVIWKAFWLASDGRELDSNSDWLQVSGTSPENIQFRPGESVKVQIAPVWSDRVTNAVSIRIIVDFDNKVAESDENNIKTINFPFPDLVIVEPVDINPASKDVQVTFKNNGNAPLLLSGPRGNEANQAFWQVFWLAADGRELQENRNYMTAAGNDGNLSFQPGETFTLEMGPVYLDRASDAVSVRIVPDSTDKVDESDENNAKTIKIPLPDLKIDSITFDRQTAAPQIVISNIGSAKANFRRTDTGADYDSDIAFGCDDARGQPVLEEKGCPETISLTSFKDSLATSESMVVTVPPLPGNIVEFRAVVRHFMPEQDHGSETTVGPNNSMGVDVPLPDLAIVEPITFDPTLLYPIITVKNQGDVLARSAYAIGAHYIWVSATGDYIGEWLAVGNEFTELAAGQSGIINRAGQSYYSLPPQNAVKVYIKADRAENINESNEDNNAIEADLPLPDLAIIEPITFDQTLRYPIITVKNQGAAAMDFSGSFTVQVYWLRADGSQINQYAGTSGPWYSLEFGASMGIGATQTKPDSSFQGESSLMSPPSGARKAKVIVDNRYGRSEIVESNEDNNEMIVDLPEADADNLIYPIAELGNCRNREECRAYCSQPENTEACTAFGVNTGLLTEEEAEAAEELNEINENNPGPGNCTDRESCKEFCEAPANIEACLNYAEQNNWMSADDLSKARKVASVLQAGGSTPGGCTTPGGCKDYCSDNTHAVECVAFGKTAGLLTKEEAEEAEKIAPLMQGGAMPGGKTNREELEAYCETNRDECDQFFEQAGVKKGSATTTIFQKEGSTESAGPGGCKTKAECEAYCDSHPGECDEQVKQAGGEVKEVTVPCSTNEECRVFCAAPANAKACENIKIEETPEEAEASKPEVINEEIEKLRQNILEMPSQSQDCVKQAWGAENFDRVMSGQAPETPVKAEDLQSCYSQGVQKQGEEAARKPEGQEQRDAEAGNFGGNLFQIVTNFIRGLFGK